MTSLRQQIVDEARTYMNTPWEHQGRTKHVGVDCMGLIVLAPRPVLNWVYDRSDYERTPDGVSIMQACREHLVENHPPKSYGLGDVVIMHFNDMPHHMGIVGDYRWGGFSLIHAHQRASPTARVVEHRLDEQFWQPRIIASFQYPGVDQ